MTTPVRIEPKAAKEWERIRLFSGLSLPEREFASRTEAVLRDWEWQIEAIERTRRVILLTDTLAIRYEQISDGWVFCKRDQKRGWLAISRMPHYPTALEAILAAREMG